MKTITIKVPTISKASIYNTLAKVKQPFTKTVEVTKEVEVEVIKTITNTNTIIKVPHLIIGKNHTLKGGITLKIQSMDSKKTITEIQNADPLYNCGEFYLVETIINETINN